MNYSLLKLCLVALFSILYAFEHPAMYIMVFDKPRGSVNTQFTGRTLSIGGHAYYIPPSYHYGSLKAMKTERHIVVSIGKSQAAAVSV